MELHHFYARSNHRFHTKSINLNANFIIFNANRYRFDNKLRNPAAVCASLPRGSVHAKLSRSRSILACSELSTAMNDLCVFWTELGLF